MINLDLILTNGNIYKIDKNNNIVNALAVKDGRIHKTGSNEEILSLKQENTKVINLDGKTVLPGFNDSHMHILSYGYSLTQVDLIGTNSIEDLKNRMSNHIKTNNIEIGKWIKGRGWNHDYFKDNKVFPTRYDLDKVSQIHPILVTRTCGHVASVNSKALEIMGIKKGSPQIEGGHFDLDENGEPTGIFREKALSQVYNSIASPNIHEIKDMIIAAISQMNRYGLTSAGTDDLGALPDNDYEKVILAYNELKNENKLNIRVYEQCLIPDFKEYENFIKKAYITGSGDEFFKIGPLKILLDGSLGARTAALNQPYEDDRENTGIITCSQDDLDKIVNLANKNDCQVAIHGIGDRAIEMGLLSIERALNSNKKQDHRHGIVHAQITNEKIFNKFKDLDAIAYIQPIFLDYDWSIVASRIGSERESTSYNWRAMIDMGIHCAMGSDSPVETFDPMKGIYEAVTRKDLTGKPKDGWLPEQALTVAQAIEGYTIEGAYASFEENIKGSIEDGKLADIVVLNKNPYSVNPDEIKDIEVEMTIVNGEIVYESK